MRRRAERRTGAPVPLFFLALALSLASPGCGGSGADRLGVAGGLVVGRRGTDVVFSLRLDGTVIDHRAASVTREGNQFLLITGKAAGRDQSKLIVVDPDGSIAVDYRLSGVSPFPLPRSRAYFEGETLRQLQAAVPQLVQTFTYRGRRLLLAATRDNYAPSSLVLLEAVAPDRVEERFVFWNFGHIHMVVEAAPHVVILGFSNRLRERKWGYPNFAAVFHLDDLEWGAGRCARGISPTLDDPRAVDGAAYRSYAFFPTVRATSWAAAEIRDGALHAATDFGVVYTVDLATGAVNLRATDVYRADYARRRKADPSLPALDVHLASRMDNVRVWRRGS